MCKFWEVSSVFVPPENVGRIFFVTGSCEGRSFSSHCNCNPFEVVRVLLLTGEDFLQSQQSAGESQTVLVFVTGDFCGRGGAEARTSSLMVAVVGPIYVPLLLLLTSA